MTLSIIVAHDEGLLIGREGGLPWRHPEDLAHFRRVTMGHPVVMGRRVFEEIGEKPLPGRRNLVLSTTKTWPDADVECFESFDEALEALAQVEGEVFVIGGRALYERALPIARTLHVTLVPGSHEGDTWFPDYRGDIGRVWKETARSRQGVLTFVEYARITPPPL